MLMLKTSAGLYTSPRLKLKSSTLSRAWMLVKALMSFCSYASISSSIDFSPNIFTMVDADVAHSPLSSLRLLANTLVTQSAYQRKFGIVSVRNRPTLVLRRVESKPRNEVVNDCHLKCDCKSASGS